MRKFVRSLAFVFALSLVVPGVAMAQGTPEAKELAESDALWGGNYVDQLPSCEGDGLCLASLTHAGDPGVEEYYHGIIQNNSSDWVMVRTVTVTLFDEAGEFAAQGDTFSVDPGVISPGGHALIGLTVSGEYLSDFTTEAQFNYEPSAGGENGSGVGLRIDSAELRGSAILGEFTNTSPYTFNTVWVRAACFADDGSIGFTMFEMVQNGPYANEASDRYAIELYSHDCTNFVVTAYGSPY